MKESNYLYGENFDAKALRELHYPQALLRKNIWAKELSDLLLEVHYLDRDNKRLNDIAKAIKFNYELYDECYEKEPQ